MSERIDAIYEHGVFRPESPVHVADGQRVSLHIEARDVDALADVADLLDLEFAASCRDRVGRATSLAAVQTLLGAFPGSVADLISEDRDER